AIFMATDYVTSPSTAWGKVLFALGAGLLTCLIRYYGTYPEGVSFAILFMNILTPYIERWTRRKVFAAEGGKA
ncbi:MAG: RnfABCDGE type electron transport complex subunit D, partial [Clostridia bacterium]|nr:RnfABCDGE type electron transport complex subunit D [Clostridia bacterium]